MSPNQDRIGAIERLLRGVFGIVPIVAGVDKFLNLLTDWTHYVNPTFAALLPLDVTTFMYLIGAVEVAAGVIVLSRYTTIGAYVVSAWLAFIALTLIASGRFLDVAVRDLVMSTGAYSLAVLSQVRQGKAVRAYENVGARTSVA
jgi:hypothetical protein